MLELTPVGSDMALWKPSPGWTVPQSVYADPGSFPDRMSSLHRTGTECRNAVIQESEGFGVDPVWSMSVQEEYPLARMCHTTNQTQITGNAIGNLTLSRCIRH